MEYTDYALEKAPLRLHIPLQYLSASSRNSAKTGKVMPRLARCVVSCSPGRSFR